MRKAVIKTGSINTWLKKATNSRQKELFIIVFISFIQGFLWTMMVTTVPLLVKDAGIPEFQLGVITSLPALIAIIFCIPGSSLSLKYGTRKILMFGQISAFVGGLFYLHTQNIQFIMVPQIFLGISNMLHWPAEGAYKTKIINPEQRAALLSYTMLVSNLGSTASPLLAGRIIDSLGYRPVFILFMAMSAAGAFAASFLPEIPCEGSGNVLETVIGGYKTMARILARPIVQITVALSFFQLITMSAGESFLAAYMRGLGYSATLVGVSVTVRTASMSFILLFTGALIRKYGVLNIFFASSFAGAAAYILTPFFPSSAAILVSSFIGGLSLGSAPVLSSAMLAENTDGDERGIAMALNMTMVNAGRTFSGFGFGAIASFVGYGPALALANAFVMAGSAATALRYRKISKDARSAFGQTLGT